MSSFPGNLRCYKGISLDRFDKDNLKSTVYWLSHAHSDHMIGLESASLLSHLKANSSVKIYCSEVTKKILSNMGRYKHLKDSLVPLEIDEPTSIIIPQSHPQKVNHVSFTAIAAGHCPGSAMLLIEGGEGTVLYTGDFRYETGTAALIGPLHDNSGRKKEIDELYCDTTFLTPKARFIATRDECSTELLSHIKGHICKGSNYQVLLRIKAKLGYENVFRSIYDELGMKTHVQQRDLELYSEIPEILETVTTDPTETQIHACCRYISKEDGEDDNHQKHPDYKCFVLSKATAVTKVIILSTMWFVSSQQKELSAVTSYGALRCCYSFHSSHAEIEDFVRYIQPKKVYPNVYPIYNDKQQTERLLNEFISGNQSRTLSPEISDSWKSIGPVEAWWMNKAEPPIKRCKVETTPFKDVDTSSNHSKATDRSSTPEMELWSDSEQSDIEAPVTPRKQKNNSYSEEAQHASTNLDAYDSDEDLNIHRNNLHKMDEKMPTFINTVKPRCELENKDTV